MSKPYETLGNYIWLAIGFILLAVAGMISISAPSNAMLRGVASGGSGTVPSATCSSSGGVIYASSGAFTCNSSFTTDGAGAVSASALVTAQSLSATSGTSNSAPIIKLTTVSGTGLGLGSNSDLTLWYNSGVRFTVTASGFVADSASGYRWGSGGYGTTADTGLFRCAVATICAGNGSVSDSSGTVSSGAIVTNSINIAKTVTPIGTTGSITNNSLAGTVNIASAAATATVTNSSTTANSIIVATARTNDTTCSVKNVVPGSGSFVVNMTANCTSATSVGYAILSP